MIYDFLFIHLGFSPLFYHPLCGRKKIEFLENKEWADPQAKLFKGLFFTIFLSFFIKQILFSKTNGLNTLLPKMMALLLLSITPCF